MNALKDLEVLEGGRPPSEFVARLNEFVSELPEAMTRLFTTREGLTLLLYTFAAGVTLSAVDFDNAMAMVKAQLPDGAAGAGETLNLGNLHFEDEGDDDDMGRIYLGSSDSRHQAFFVQDPPGVNFEGDSAGVLPNAGIEFGLGINQVDSVEIYPAYSSPETDKLLAYVHSEAIAQGVVFAPDAAVIRLTDTELRPTSSNPALLDQHRGGFTVESVEKTDIIFARSALTGQAIVVLAQNEDGSLTGFKTGDERAKASEMVFGEGESARYLGIYIEIDGQRVFQPLYDPDTGRILVPTGEIEGETGAVFASTSSGKPLASLVAAFNNYESPAFNALQDMVAQEETGKYTLISVEDGLLFDGKPTGIDVDANGVMTIDVNGEDVVVDPSAVHLGPDGVQVDGYELDDDGEWEMAQLTPEQQLAVDMGKFKLDLDKDGYKIEYDADGKIELRNNSGRLVYWDGKWNSKEIVKLIVATDDCKETPFVPASSTANWSENVSMEEFEAFIHSIVKKAKLSPFFIRSPGPSPGYAPVPFKGTNNCWGVRFHSRDDGTPQLAWPKANGEVEVVGVFEPQ